MSSEHMWLVSLAAMWLALQSGWLSWGRQTSYLHAARVGVGVGSWVCTQSHNVKWHVQLGSLVAVGIPRRRHRVPICSYHTQGEAE